MKKSHIIIYDWLKFINSNCTIQLNKVYESGFLNVFYYSEELEKYLWNKEISFNVSMYYE